MLTWAIILTVVLVILGIACIGFIANDENDEDEPAIPIALCALQVAASAAATALYCFYSPKGSYACGIIFTVTTGVLIITQMALEENDIDEVAPETLMRVMIGANLACAIGGYLNIYAFLELAISLSAIIILAGISIAITFDCNGAVGFHVVNIALTVIIAAGLAVGYSMWFLMDEGVTAVADCHVFIYDDMNSTAGDKEQSELCFNEYYALRVDFEWKNLMAYTTQSEQVRIQVSFPAAVDYISGGMGFKASSNKKVWTYDLELSSFTEDKMRSGYFVFNYGYDTISKPIEPFNVHIGPVPSDKDSKEEKKTDGIFIEYDCDYKYSFKKKNYPFTKDNCIKDLSQADDGYYRITMPDECESLTITIYNNDKSGLYCLNTVYVNKDFYRLSIPQTIESNIAESVYNKLLEDKEELIVEITAVGNNNYADTSISFTYTIE